MKNRQGWEVIPFGVTKMAFPFIRKKVGRQEDGSSVSVEPPEICRFSGFSL